MKEVDKHNGRRTITYYTPLYIL